ncbi:hypothetical protein ACLMJK_008863 [Lecanora helva]
MPALLILVYFLIGAVISSGSSSLSTSNSIESPAPVTNLSTPVSLQCETRPMGHRRNVRAIDCLNLFTFILATEPDHTQPITYSLRPGQRSGAIVWSRSSGGCEFFVTLGQARHKAPLPETTTLDRILGVGLGIVSDCFLNGQADDTHWAGAGKFDYQSKVKIGILGSLPQGDARQSGNGTLLLDPGAVDWMDDLLES